MRTTESIERDIARLRERSHKLFLEAETKPNNWRMMDTIREKTIALWAQWHRLKEKAE